MERSRLVLDLDDDPALLTIESECSRSFSETSFIVRWSDKSLVKHDDALFHVFAWLLVTCASPVARIENNEKAEAKSLELYMRIATRMHAQKKLHTILALVVLLFNFSPGFAFCSLPQSRPQITIFPSHSLVDDVVVGAAPNNVNRRLTNETIGNEVAFVRKIPIPLQNILRDSGMLRFIMDSLTRLVAAPEFYKNYPRCFPEFCRISGYPMWLVHILRNILKIEDASSSQEEPVDYQELAYGKHPNQYAEVMNQQEGNGAKPLLVFIHGGAWGSGFTTMYRLIASPFLPSHRVAILGYRVYPEAKIQAQVEDVVDGIDFLTRKYGKAVVLGHSSGAHLAMLAALNYPQFTAENSVQGIVGMSGVYDIEEQYQLEKIRGIDELSPLKPTHEENNNYRQVSPPFLISKESSLPPVLLVSGEDDRTVDPFQSELLHQSLQKNNLESELHVLAGFGHADAVIETCVGGEIQDIIQNWIRSRGVHSE